MYISQWMADSEALLKGIRAEKVKRIIKESFASLPLEITECAVRKRTILHNDKREHQRICILSVAYTELREIEQVFADIEKIEEVGLDCFHRYGVRISAIIPEIHPTIYCRVSQGWGRIGYDEGKPSDSTYAHVDLWGEIIFEDKRKALQETGADICEPQEVEPGKFVSTFPHGKVSGPTPIIRVSKIWKTFDMHAAQEFIRLIKDIDKKHCITYPDTLAYKKNFALDGAEQTWQAWIDTRYPPANIEGYFYRDARNGPYWRVYHISQFVHYDPDSVSVAS